MVVKVQGSTLELLPILVYLRHGWGSRIPGVAVKCVDIRRNTGGEGGFLAMIPDAEVRKLG